MKFSRTIILLFSTLLLGAIFRFSYLNWGYPFFFHPDEDNIANSAIRLSFTQWNPHFFAYGSLPIYVGFFSSFIVSLGKPIFLTTVYALRTISAVLSFLLIPSLFYIGNTLYGKKVGVISALLATVSIGFIQYAHFGTFEMWLTFFTLWFFYFCLAFWKYPNRKNTLLMGLCAGVLISIKVSTVVFLPIPLFLLLEKFSQKKKNVFRFASLYILLIILVFSITNPFFFFDTNSYVNSLLYEGSVASGYISVFYTQSFLRTTPVLFQLTKVYPFLLNPFVFLAFLFSFLQLIWLIKKQRKSQDIFLVSFFLIAFLSQAFLFVKWTRYMLPSLPFMYLITAYAISKLKTHVIFFSTLGLFCISLFYSTAFFITVYPKDSRIAASTFPKTEQSVIIEPYDVGALPFIGIFPGGKIVNMYDLETDMVTQDQLPSLLQTSDVFFSPSQRVWHTRLANPIDFPRGNTVYKNLFNGSYGYSIAYQTPCPILCKIIYSGDPIQNVEETATVFDHPFITIFKK